MANRVSNQQINHDKVLEAACQYLDKSKYDVYSNPGSMKNTQVGNYWPDIIVTKKRDNNVLFIIEVETPDSVTDNEAKNQWKDYSELGSTFYLLVPYESRNDAELLCRANKIKARFGTYSYNNNHEIVIKYE